MFVYTFWTISGAILRYFLDQDTGVLAGMDQDGVFLKALVVKVLVLGRFGLILGLLGLILGNLGLILDNLGLFLGLR